MLNRKYWVFTQFLASPHNLHWATLPPGVDYVIYQQEMCPDTLRMHYQGYIQLSSSQYMTFLKNIISSNVHLEPQRAPSTDQARDYCLKDRTAVDGPWELGTYVSHTSRRKKQTAYYDDFRDAILSGATERSMWMDYAPQMFRFGKAFQSLYCYGTTSLVPRVIARREEPPHVTVLIGPTGCGKTRYAYDKHGPEDLYVLPITDGFWLDGYSGQLAILYDEFTGNLPLLKFLSLLDRYSISVARKGGFVLYAPDRIYITSNLAPFSWYEWILRRRDGTVKQDRTLQRAAMYRRFSTVLYDDGTGGGMVDVTGSDYDNLV